MHCELRLFLAGYSGGASVASVLVPGLDFGIKVFYPEAKPE